MTWNSVWPNGAVSVKSNKVPGQQNTAYTETIMNVDHFWNRNAAFSGYHNQVTFPTKVLANPPYNGANGSADGTLYLRQVATLNSHQELFLNNFFYQVTVGGKPFQVTPTKEEGTIQIPFDDNYYGVIQVPPQVYGEIYMWLQTPDEDLQNALQVGYFVSNGTQVDTYSVLQKHANTSSSNLYLEFANGEDDSPNLFIQVRTIIPSTLIWNYRVLYRGTGL